jgi:hypothetical protein
MEDGGVLETGESVRFKHRYVIRRRVGVVSESSGRGIDVLIVRSLERAGDWWRMTR